MNVTTPRLIAAYIAGPAVAVGITMAGIFGIPAVAEATSVNPETAAVWVAGYGLELNGPGGVALVQCYQSADVGLTTVEC